MVRLIAALFGTAMLMLISVFVTAEDHAQATSKTSKPPIEPAASICPPKTIDEARCRAKLLFEMANGSLQVMHRDFFDEENMTAIPSASLEDVFGEVRKAYGVEMRWLIAGTDTVNADHLPHDAFETKAANVLKQGTRDYEEQIGNEYRFAGAITLRSQCLKCHVKDRKSTEDRFAGLVIRMKVEDSLP